MEENKCISCIKDSKTGKCYDLKDKLAREKLKDVNKRYLHKIRVGVMMEFEGEVFPVGVFLIAVKNNIAESMETLPTLQDKINFFNKYYTYDLAFVNNESESFDMARDPFYIQAVEDDEQNTEFSACIYIMPLANAIDNGYGFYVPGNFLEIQDEVREIK